MKVKMTQVRVQHIHPTRGGPCRGGRRGGLCFDVKWNMYEEIERIPFEDFVELEDDSINLHLVRILRKYHCIAQDSPHQYRRCVACRNRVHNGRILCNRQYCCAVHDILDSPEINLFR